MEVHEFSDILQDIGHDGFAKYILKINGIEFGLKNIQINKNNKDNIVDIIIQEK